MSNNLYDAGELKYVPGIPVPVGSEATWSETCPKGFTKHTIVKGDTLSKIATDHETTVAAILLANPGLRTTTKLVIGKSICVPPPTACSGRRYTLKSGDTLYNIAISNGLTLDELLKANPLINPKFYRVGDTICIPSAQGGGGGTDKCPGMATYTVKSGDTLTSVAERYSMSYCALKKANMKVDFMTLTPGVVLCVDATPDKSGCNECEQYQVGAGESLNDVAKKTGVSTDDLLMLNPALPPKCFCCGNTVCTGM